MKTLALLKGELHFLIIKTEKLLPIVQISLGAAGSVITPAMLNLENVSGDTHVGRKNSVFLCASPCYKKNSLSSN